MQIDLMDVRLDAQRRPYAVHETIAEYGNMAIQINTPEKTVRLMNDVFHMKNLAEEHIYVILLTSNYEVISFAEISRGIIDKTLFGIREIMQRALLCNASKVIVAHNHPSGRARPSAEDIDVTKKLFDAGNLMEIKFADHLIIAGDSYFSFFEDYKNEQEKKEKIL